MSDVASEMRIISPCGEKLYLSRKERADFLESSKHESSSNRMFCSVLHYTGCRPSEALEIKPSSFDVSDPQYPNIKFKKT